MNIEIGKLQLLEAQLEPEDQASFRSTITNKCSCVRLIDITIGYQFPADDSRISIVPNLTTQTIEFIEPGQTLPLSIEIKTSGAVIGAQPIRIIVKIGSIVPVANLRQEEIREFTVSRD